MQATATGSSDSSTSWSEELMAVDGRTDKKKPNSLSVPSTRRAIWARSDRGRVVEGWEGIRVRPTAPCMKAVSSMNRATSSCPAETPSSSAMQHDCGSQVMGSQQQKNYMTSGVHDGRLQCSRCIHVELQKPGFAKGLLVLTRSVKTILPWEKEVLLALWGNRLSKSHCKDQDRNKPATAGCNACRQQVPTSSTWELILRIAHHNCRP